MEQLYGWKVLKVLRIMEHLKKPLVPMKAVWPSQKLQSFSFIWTLSEDTAKSSLFSFLEEGLSASLDCDVFWLNSVKSLGKKWNKRMFYLITQWLARWLKHVRVLMWGVTLCATVLTAAMSETVVSLKKVFYMASDAKSVLWILCLLTS